MSGQLLNCRIRTPTGRRWCAAADGPDAGVLVAGTRIAEAQDPGPQGEPRSWGDPFILAGEDRIVTLTGKTAQNRWVLAKPRGPEDPQHPVARVRLDLVLTTGPSDGMVRR